MRFLIVLFAVLPLFLEAAEYQWVKVTTKAAFAARDGAGALTFTAARIASRSSPTLTPPMA